MFWNWARFQNPRDDHGKENETKNRPPEIADAAATQSVIGSAVRSLLVPPLCSLSRNAARGGAGRGLVQRTAPRPYGTVLRTRAGVSWLSTRPPLGGRKPRALSAVVCSR